MKRNSKDALNFPIRNKGLYDISNKVLSLQSLFSKFYGFSLIVFLPLGHINLFYHIKEPLYPDIKDVLSV